MYDTTQLVARLADVYLEFLQNKDNIDFESFENESISFGYELISSAMSVALNRWDEELCVWLPEGCKIHELRQRTLVTEVGAVVFERRVCRDRYNNPFVPLDEELDVCHGSRVSPGALSFLVEAGSEVSYAKAAHLLTRKSKAKVSAMTVMRAMRVTGDLLEQETIQEAQDLFVNGVVPKSEQQASQIRLEADGTWVSIQGQENKIEIKALVAYGRKEKVGNKKKRVDSVHFGCVASSKEFWTQGIALVGKKFDLAKIETCHFGTDGGGWCRAGARYLPGRIDVVGHLDPFHVNRAIYRCFSESDYARQVLECVWRDRVEEAIEMLEQYTLEGIATEKNAKIVCSYLRNNSSIISVPGPSLGTMEAENQHVYKSRMASVPCAWSIKGASDMARIRSSVFSKHKLPRRKRSESLSKQRNELRQKNIIKSLTYKDYLPVKYEGEGYEPPQGHILYTTKRSIRFRSGLHSR